MGNPNDKDGLGRLVKHPDSLIEGLNATVKAPNFQRPGTRRFDPSAAVHK